MKASRVIVAGRVQGVGYRVWSRHRARSLGVRGWVRNLSDGTVELMLIGNEEAVALMLEECRRGPPGAWVERLEELPGDEAGVEDDFVQLPTL
jgi:acylphosphatase